MSGIICLKSKKAFYLVIIYAKSTTLDLVCVRGSAFVADGEKTAFRAPSAPTAYHGQSLLSSAGGAPPPSSDH